MLSLLSPLSFDLDLDQDCNEEEFEELPEFELDEDSFDEWCFDFKCHFSFYRELDLEWDKLEDDLLEESDEEEDD